MKIAVGVAAAGVFGVLFVRSLDDARTTPYTVPAQHLSGWTLALESTSAPNDPMLVLRPPPELASGLFKQIFSRAMESLNTPVSPAVPLVLRGEFDRVVGDQLTPDALLAAARDAGLASAAPVPRCLVHRHVSEPGGVRQVFFVYFDAPGAIQFRQADRPRRRCDVAGPRRCGGGGRLQYVASAAGRPRGRLPGARGSDAMIYDTQVTTIDGRVITLERYRGKLLLVVNVASQCGFTPQYRGLEALYRSHKDDLVVLAFPCNQFGTAGARDGQ